MRDIKFRAWYSGEMYENCAVVDGKALRRGHFATDLFSDFSELAELMQFTGLTDANGVEIYEGDIVRDHVGIGIVKYSDKHCAFRVSYGDGLAKWFYDYYLNGERESIEVIGNIHQNPELLK